MTQRKRPRAAPEEDSNKRENPRETATSAAPGGAVVPSDPDLAMIIEQWPTLPALAKAGIMALVHATEVVGAEVDAEADELHEIPR